MLEDEDVEPSQLVEDFIENLEQMKQHHERQGSASAANHSDGRNADMDCPIMDSDAVMGS